MRLAALLDNSVYPLLARALVPGQTVTQVGTAAAIGELVRAGSCDAILLDAAVLDDRSFAQLAPVLSQQVVPVLLLADLTAASVRNVVRIAELGVHELVLQREGDTARLLAHKLAALHEHSVPARVLNQVARRFSRFPQQLQASAVALFGDGRLPRWVGEFASESGMPRRSLDRWMARVGIDGASRLLMVARLARVWEPLAVHQLTVTAVSRQCGYPRPRLFISHSRRHVNVSPEEIALSFSSQGFAALLTRRLVGG